MKTQQQLDAAASSRDIYIQTMKRAVVLYVLIFYRVVATPRVYINNMQHFLLLLLFMLLMSVPAPLLAVDGPYTLQLSMLTFSLFYCIHTFIFIILTIAA